MEYHCDLGYITMLREFGHFLGLGYIDGSVWLLYVFFIGFQSGPTKVVEGIDSYAYLKDFSLDQPRWSKA
jgi:hypothetical protein